MFKFFKEKLKKFFKKESKEIAKQAEKVEEGTEERLEEPLEKKREFKSVKEETKGREEKESEEEREVKAELAAKEGVKEEKPVKQEKKGFFAKLRPHFVFMLNEEIFEKFWQDLETVLLENNVALEVSDKIKESLKSQLVEKEIEKDKIEEKIREALKNSLENIIIEPFSLVEGIKKYRKEADKPYVIVFFGINGSGKTTSIAKLANFLKQNDLSCVFAASDTFRAASIEQLEKHASKLNVKVIKHDYGADAAAVAFDAISHAKAAGIDVVLVDTAGRMHTQGNLMREMEKICSVAKPALKIFVGEAIVGNDMVEQAKTFDEAAGIDAIILTKSDVDEKGGAAISASYITSKPILFLGTGQKYSDLEPFKKEKILNNLGLI